MKLILSLSMIFLFACSKEVSKSGSNNLGPVPPKGSFPSQTTGSTTLSFANHALVGSGEVELTVYKMTESMSLIVPTEVKNTTFNNAVNHPALGLYANQDLVCVYSWAANKYQAVLSSCYRNVVINIDDKLTLTNIPEAQTASLEFEYSKL